MKKLVFNIILLVIPVLVIVFVILFIPSKDPIGVGCLFAQPEKDSMMLYTPNPRIIFIGGSNLSFGLNSKLIKDSLGLNPINMGIHAGLGLKFMLSDAINYIRKNDIVVVVPEYQQFYGDYQDGSLELLSMAVDVNPPKLKLDFDQIKKIMLYIPEYSINKIMSLLIKKNTKNDLVGRNSFNKYGDTYVHWTMPRATIHQPYPITGNLNQNSIDLLKEFAFEAKNIGAKIFISYPGYQDMSFDRGLLKIKEVESLLTKDKFTLLGTPERYRMNDTLIFNYPYHLTKIGVDYRTNLLIEDLKMNGIK